MKVVLAAFLVLSSPVIAQINSGDYGELKIAFSPNNRIVTGYYENYSGHDEATLKPKFSCIFYFIGQLASSKAVISSYYPLDTTKIIGMFELADSNGVQIKFPKEHGGCWNVQHFADGPVEFKLQQKMSWIEIRYATKDRVHFHSGPPSSSTQSDFIMKGDIVYVSKIIDQWAYCTYYGIKETTGWLRLSDLNELDY